MSAPVLYFAYGSNMSLRRLRARVPAAQPLGTARLPGHELRFHKRGQDGSGKCDAYFVDDPSAHLIGVLFDIPPTGKDVLDRIEGLGCGYNEKIVSVLTAGGGREKALTYYATDIDASLLPFCWYKHHVMAGAREFGLPAAYQSSIAAVNTREDDDPQRRARESALYHALS